MKKLIEYSQDNFLECDNEQCDFVIPNHIIGIHWDAKEFIDCPCPKCRENLLTEQDYLDDLKLTRTINFLNRWFSWLTIFFPNIGYKKEAKSVTVKVHNGIKIEQ